jgi:hypothetical protein
MQKVYLFLATLLFIQTSLAGEFTVFMDTRTPTTDDPNKFILSINGSTSLGPKELHAFKGCISQVTLVDSTTEEETLEAKKNFLRLAEIEVEESDSKYPSPYSFRLRNAMAKLNDTLGSMTCDSYDSGDKVNLTNKTDVGFSTFLSGPLRDCLKGELDTSDLREFHGRKENLTLANKDSEERKKYCD